MITGRPKTKMPVGCPSCGGDLHVRSLACPDCGTRVEGDYLLPLFMRLTAEEQRFLFDFIRCGGSLKELAAQRSLSYPTVRNRLDEVLDRIKALETKLVKSIKP